MRLKVSLCLLALLVMVSGAAYADTSTSGTISLKPGFTVETTLNTYTSTSTYDFSLDFVNTSGITYYVTNWDMQLFTGAFTLNSSASQNGFTIYDGSKADNGTNTCSVAGSHDGWLCADGTNFAVLTGTTLSFDFSGSYTGSPILGSHFQGSGNIPGQSGNQWSYSDSFTVCSTNCTSTPEPASLALLSAGLLGLAGLVRRKRA